ncbi:acyltransferase [Vagococcus hydrophili]|uniref:Acyltransferase n=1 Tax=Vagococcus hydrophili TaxID=2714947 RepID=A0A6G8ARI2_9ENTE|nr:acyltransferase family protein [Vagococcus hydrophili]QIL47579.1 acyltransferase [Vagococcus hydrophili]
MTNFSNNIARENDYYFSYIVKIFASIMVVMNHTISFRGINLDTPSTSLYISIVVFAIAKTGVPLFLMTTGFFSLRSSKIYSTKDYMKRFMKNIFFLYSLTVLVWLVKNYFSNDFLPFNYANLYSENISNIYWYFFLLLGIDIMLPFFKKISDSSTIKELLYLIFIIFLFQSFLPLILKRFALPGVNFYFMSSIFNMSIGYLFLGQLVYRLKDKLYKNIKPIILSILLFISGFTIFVLLMLNEVSGNSKFNLLFWDDRNSFYVLFESFAIFVLFYSVFSFIRPFDRLMSLFSRATFFIFAFSDIIILIVDEKKYRFAQKQIIDNFLFFILVYFICMFSGVFYYSVKQKIKKRYS